MSAPAVLQAIQAHPAVHDTCADADGCWVWMHPGFRSVVMECGTVHESSWTKCAAVMRQGIERYTCCNTAVDPAAGVRGCANCNGDNTAEWVKFVTK